MVAAFLLVLIGLPVLLFPVTATGFWRRHATVLGSLVPWVALLGVITVAVPTGGIEWPGVMLGSGLVFDNASRLSAALCALLFLALGLIHRRRIVESPETAACFLSAWTGVIVQCLTGEMLLFLAAAATSGYSMLGFTLAASRPDRPLRIAAIATVMLAGDLALLELATLLVEVRTGSFYPVAAETLSGMRGQPLVELCIALGLAARLTLPFVVILWARTSKATLVKTLPGWLALAACSVLASWRLAPGSPGDGLTAPWITELAWALPLLPVVLALPYALARMLDGMDGIGRLAAGLRNIATGLLPRPELKDLPSVFRGIEARLISWPTAMSALVLLALALLVALV